MLIAFRLMVKLSLLVRVMRIIVAVGLCAESGVEKYKANTQTSIMTTTQGTSSFKTWFDLFAPAAVKFPEYMRAQEYQNPTKSTASAFAYSTGSEFWDYLKANPEHAQTFNDFMATRRQGKPSWYDVYPIGVELLSQDVTEQDILLVDVGGNRGHDLINLKARHPALRGKLILQDLPDVVVKANFDPSDNIRAMAHNFFEAQPIYRKYGSLELRSSLTDIQYDRCTRVSFSGYLPRLA